VAEKWEHNADYTQWTFKIRDNILWHDGTRFTAEDAKFWLELVAFGAQGGGKSRSPAYFATNFGEVKKVEVLEGNRVRISLEESSPQLLQSIYAGDSSIGHPRHLMQERIEKGEVNVTPQDVGWVSIGPYKMHKYEKGSLVQTRRSEKYWEKDEKGRQLPYLEGIDFAIIRDPAAMDAAFRVGRLDGGGLGTGHYLTKERQAGYVRDLGEKAWFAEVPATRQNLGFNVLKPSPVQDVRVRRAISLWIDREEAIASALGGFGQVYTMLGPDNPYTSPDFLTWPGWNKASKARDRAEAKRLMAEAGYANGFPMTLLLRRTWLTRGEFLAGQFRGLNIELKLELRDDAGEASGRLTLDFDSTVGSGVAFAVIPEGLEAGYTRYGLSKPAIVKHEDPKVADAFARIRATADTQQRIKQWRELERYLLVEQAYTASVFADMGVIPYRSHVKGLPVSQEGVKNTTDFATVWLDK
jgi:peptide/nickel transport system substrate-binding protein